MIDQNPEEFLEFNLRLKHQRDESARLQRALMEGRREGRREGREEGRREGREEARREARTQGRILLLQELLGLPASTSEELATWNIDQLNNLADDLQRQLKARRP
jgi:predicted transposase YdaD